MISYAAYLLLSWSSSPRWLAGWLEEEKEEEETGGAWFLMLWLASPDSCTSPPPPVGQQSVEEEEKGEIGFSVSVLFLRFLPPPVRSILAGWL